MDGHHAQAPTTPPPARPEEMARLVAGMASHFNNLLTVILGNVSLVRALLPAGDQYQAPLVAAEGAALRAADFINQLLAATGQSFLRLEPLDVGDALGRVVGRLRGDAAAAPDVSTSSPGVAWDVRVADDLWPARADSRLLTAAFDHLCRSARAAAEESGTVTVEADNVTVQPAGRAAECDRTRTGGDFVCVRVSDDGAGIPPAAQPRLFTPFASGPSGEGERGGGLGLAVVRGVVEQHGGWVELASGPGRGTAVTCYLPRDRASG